jgi:hypothetical protein
VVILSESLIQENAPRSEEQAVAPKWEGPIARSSLAGAL